MEVLSQLEIFDPDRPYENDSRLLMSDICSEQPMIYSEDEHTKSYCRESIIYSRWETYRHNIYARYYQ
jgi:hypothetical protein